MVDDETVEHNAAEAEDWAAYEPRFAIGRGQFGVVFLLQRADGRKIVDKRVALEGLTAEQLKTTQKEIEVLRRLKHENICAFLHSWTDDGAAAAGDGGAPARGTLHILLEYCDGGSLAEMVAQRQQAVGAPIQPARVRRWLVQLARALAHVHSLRIIHRDVKTANIFLGGRSGDDIKLGDFGISRLMSSQARQPQR